MRIHLILCCLLLALGARATTNNAATANLADVQASVNLCNPGDTVLLTNSGTATWTAQLTNLSSIRLIANGNVVITNNQSGGSPSVLMQFVNAGYQCEVSGFTFTSAPGRGYDAGSLITLLGQCNAVRVDNCSFIGLPSQAITFGVQNFGVVDHCIFYQTNPIASAFGIDDYTGGIGGENAGNSYGGWGDVSYSTNHPVLWGTTNDWVYVESCAFTFAQNGGSSGAYMNDVKDGGRMVVRFNMMTNAIFQTHPTLGRERGARAYEIYGNTIVHTGPYTNTGGVLWLSAGTGPIYSNTLVGFAGINQGLINYRASTYSTPWGLANGTNNWDLNTNGLIYSETHTGTNGAYFLEDTNATWSAGQFANSNYEIWNAVSNQLGHAAASLIITNTATRIYYQLADDGNVMHFSAGQSYQVYQVAQTLDGPGVGAGDLLTDTAYANQIPSNTVLHSLSWPRQQIDPIYYYANTLNGSPVNALVNYALVDTGTETLGNYNDVMLGVHYLNATKPGYTPLVYPHPLAAYSPPANPATGIIIGQPARITVNGN